MVHTSTSIAPQARSLKRSDTESMRVLKPSIKSLFLKVEFTPNLTIGRSFHKKQIPLGFINNGLPVSKIAFRVKEFVDFHKLTKLLIKAKFVVGSDNFWHKNQIVVRLDNFAELRIIGIAFFEIQRYITKYIIRDAIFPAQRHGQNMVNRHIVNVYHSSRIEAPAIVSYKHTSSEQNITSVNGGVCCYHALLFIESKYNKFSMNFKSNGICVRIKQYFTRSRIRLTAVAYLPALKDRVSAPFS